MSQCPLEGVSPQQIFEKCMDLKKTGIFGEGPLGFEYMHYWNIGRMVFYKLRQLNNGAMNERNQTLLGMEIRINYNEPYLLSIEKKPRPQYVVNLNACYPSIDVSSLIKAANTIKKGFENMFGTLRNIEIVKVIFNEPATIVIWSDGTKTVVKAQNGEVFDREKGLAMAICKKAFGNKGNYNEVFKKWVPERSNMGDNFTKRSMRVTTDALRVFASNHDLIMGIDVHPDNRPNIIKYVFYHLISGKGALIIIDFMQVEHLDKSIDTIIERLTDEFNLEE